MLEFKKIFFLAVFAIATSVCAGQKAKLSSPVRDDFSMGFTKIIGYTSSGYFVQTGNLGYDVTAEKTGFRSPKYKIGYFNANLDLVWEKSIEANPAASELVDIRFMNDQALVFSTLWNETEKTSSLYVTAYDSSGNPGANREIGKSTQLPDKPFAYGSALSLRGSYGAFYALCKTEDDQLLVSVVVLDNELRPISQMTERIQQPYKGFTIAQMVVSEDAVVAWLGKRADKPKALSSRRDLSWFVYTIKSASLIEIPVGRGLEISTLGLTTDEFRDQLVVAGFFEEKDSYVGAGILSYRLNLGDATDTALVKQTTTIDAGQNMRLKGVRNFGEGGGLASYPIRKIIPKGNGGMVVVAESAFTTEYSYFDSFSQSYTRRLEFNFGDIVMFSLNADGTIDWSSSVQKNQTSMDDGGMFSSYCMLTESKRLVVFFSEPINRKSRVLMSGVSHLGVTEKTISIQLPEGTLLLPEGARQVDEQVLIVPAVLKRKLHLVQFSLD